MIPYAKEVYTLEKRDGNQFHTICVLYDKNGKQLAFGRAKVDGIENINRTIGKQLAYAKAIQFLFKQSLGKIEIIDNTNVIDYKPIN
jgi:hypothetical protein